MIGYERSLKIVEKALGPTPPKVAVTCENMAELYRQIGKEDEANKLEIRAKNNPLKARIGKAFFAVLNPIIIGVNLFTIFAM